MTEPTSFIGYALIVNVKYFQNEVDRKDSISDQTNSLAAFKRLGFETNLVTEIEDDDVSGDVPSVYVTKSRFQRELGKAIEHVQSKGYQHFAVFVSTHGAETRKEDMYMHELCFYDEDVPTREILFEPLDKELSQVNKFVLVQACRSREGYEDEDQGVSIQVVDDPAQEYQTSEALTQVSGKSAYRNHLASLLLERVRHLNDGTRVNLLDLLRQINRRFTDEAISMDKVKDGVWISYNVCNVGSISHCLTKPIYYTIVREAVTQ